MQNIKIVARFNKSSFMRYISHRDFIRLMYRALRRADLPYVVTQGFSPRPKVKFGDALKLGKDGEMEAAFFLQQKVGLEEFKERFEKQLTEGISIVGIKYDE
ncbi:MAG: DUF2344 domain-containing protein [PVC group bacterium]|nr:DUF2344 domain-containing protein [PVC group bacterium]